MTMPNAATSEHRIAVLLLATAADLLFGEPPPPLHPVTWIGSVISGLERFAPAPSRRSNLLYGLLSTVGVLALGMSASVVAGRALRRLPAPGRLVATALLLKPAFALRMLCAAANGVGDALQNDDLEAARERLRSLVSRNTQELTASECAAGTIESLAENTTDSVIGPLLAYLCFGLPGAWAFRALNTLDSRWGYRGRYDLLGRTAAILDDLAAFVPARLSAILLVAGSAVTGGSASGALAVALRDHPRTASPNAGWTMGAMAGGLRRRLEKAGQYLLNGEAAPCEANDIRRAEQIVMAAVALGLSGPALVSCLSAVRQFRHD
jgi:adenosylcobinamide-phosphate synthase